VRQTEEKIIKEYSKRRKKKKFDFISFLLSTQYSKRYSHEKNFHSCFLFLSCKLLYVDIIENAFSRYVYVHKQFLSLYKHFFLFHMHLQEHKNCEFILYTEGIKCSAMRFLFCNSHLFTRLCHVKIAITSR
jgi:hypothetical protein